MRILTPDLIPLDCPLTTVPLFRSRPDALTFACELPAGSCNFPRCCLRSNEPDSGHDPRNWQGRRLRPLDLREVYEMDFRTEFLRDHPECTSPTGEDLTRVLIALAEHFRTR